MPDTKKKLSTGRNIDVTLPAHRAGETWIGPTQSVTAGEILTIGEVAYLKSDGKYWLADGSSKMELASSVAVVDAADLTSTSVITEPVLDGVRLIDAADLTSTSVITEP